jgi:hypothetical protein
VADQDTKQRDRSPNYPYISLQQALERARQFYAGEKRGAAAVPVVAAHWQYSPKSSGLIQSIAALKAYGLMDEDGRGQERRLKLSDLALRIILDQRPQSQERNALLRRAAMTPSVAQRIMEKFPQDMPSDHNLEHFLIFDLKFNPDSAKAAVNLFFENADFTGIYDIDNIPSVPDEQEEQVKGSGSQHTGPTIGSGQGSVGISGAATGVANAVKELQRITGPTGDIIIQFIGDATLEAYEYLENYIKLRKTAFKPSGVSVEAKLVVQPAKEEKKEAMPGIIRRTMG